MHDKKLRLNVDDLAVESFNPGPQVERWGTVHGAEDTADGMTYCARTQCMLTECVAQSCKWTECNNLSCLAPGCAGGSDQTIAGQPTCHAGCGTTTSPPPIE
jgi:hypothetical protein